MSPAHTPASPLVAQVAAHVRARFLAEPSGHDWHHIARVWRLARELATAEGADPEVTELGALLHDIADWKFHGGDDGAGPRAAAQLLDGLGAAPALRDAVVEIVATVSFKGAGVATPMRTVEGRCVQDADRLDALGAIGIARCFAYGGHVGRPLHDPDVAPVLHASADAYKAAQGTSLNHFYEKLLLLQDRMTTASGRRLAAARHRTVAAFVRAFLDEWGDSPLHPLP